MAELKNASIAKATFLCGAKSTLSPSPNAICGNTFSTNLFNDGQYTNFLEPEGWYVKLGLKTDGSENVIRCPTHATFDGWDNGGWKVSP